MIFYDSLLNTIYIKKYLIITLYIVLANQGDIFVLKGNPVRIRNCPRNCKCGRTGYPLYCELHGSYMGRASVDRSTSQETCLGSDVSILGARDGEMTGTYYLISVVL